jgi:hypothetical protein
MRIEIDPAEVDAMVRKKIAVSEEDMLNLLWRRKLDNFQTQRTILQQDIDGFIGGRHSVTDEAELTEQARRVVYLRTAMKQYKESDA